jgi:hypothetical protein
VTTTLLFGDLRGGRITDTLDVTGCSWSQVANDAGTITQVVVQGHEVRAKKLRAAAPTARSFLAVDVDGRLQEAGPIWSRSWDDEAQTLTLGASGLWSLFDHRKVLPALDVYTGRVQDAVMSTGNFDLGSIAHSLVGQAMSHVGGDLPLVLEDFRAGTHTETWYGWQLLKVGDQIRQLTQRENGPDIRFRPDYTTDKLGMQWFLETGTEDEPLLTQAGDDWFFDATVSRSPVLNINTDEDGTQQGMRSWATGNGSEADILIGTAYDPTLIDQGWPLLEVDESDSTVLDQDTLDSHAAALVQRSARPIEAWKVQVTAASAREVLAGHYARVVVPEGHAYLPGGEAFLRVQSKAGDLTTKVTLTMYPIAEVA